MNIYSVIITLCGAIRMRRRIIKQGHNTLTMTLPSEWAKRFNLRAGDEVEILERDNGLFICTEKADGIRRAEFDITGMDIPTIWKYFMAVYRQGYSEARIRFNPETRLEFPYKWTQHKLDAKYGDGPKRTVLEAMHGFVSRFIGFEIVESGRDYVIVKEMGELTGKEFDSSLRRIFLLLQQMADEIVKAIRTRDARTLVNVHDMDNSVDKFHDYCIRILNKVGNKEPKKTSVLCSIIFILEMMGDEFKNISIHLIQDFPDVKLKDIEKVTELIRKHIALYYELYYKFDKATVKAIAEIDQKEHFASIEVGKKIKEEGARELLHHLNIISRDLYALVELRIEMEY